MAYFHMDGEALVWFEDAEDTGLFVSWDAFIQALISQIWIYYLWQSIEGYYLRTTCSCE